MAGTDSGDELALLVANFVEEVRPFVAGIRRGVGGIFALPRDAQAIGAARTNLATLAASVKILDLPAARQLGELAQILTEGFTAAERGGVPDESRAPLLAIVDQLEAQLAGLLHSDGQGRERLDASYRLLEQVLQTVEQAEASPPPLLDISLDDLLLTLQPAAPAVPEAAPAPLPAPPPLPEPTQTEIVLVAEDAVAPIEWGTKETILWNKGGWNERKTAYGNTEWIFLDEESGTNQLVARAGLILPMEAQGDVATADETLAEPSAEPASEQRASAAAPDTTASAPLSGAATAEAPAATPATLPQQGEADGLPLPVAVAAPPATDERATAGPVVSAPAPLGNPGATSLDARALEEAALLAFSWDELAHYLALPEDEQQVVLQIHLGEMADFATDLGLGIAPDARAATATGELAALLNAAAHAGGTPRPTAERGATTAALPGPIAAVPAGQPSAAATQRAAGIDRPLATDAAPPPLTPTADERARPATARALTATSTDDASAETSPPTEIREDAADRPARAAGVVGAPGGDEERAPVDDLLLTEYRPADHATGMLGGAFADPGDLAHATEGAERIRAARLAAARRSLGTTDLRDESGEADDDGGFLAALLDEETGDGADATRGRGGAAERFTADDDGPGLNFAADDDDGDLNFAALPEVAPEIEAAFARLSEADINTFLALDGDAALTFLRERAATPNGEDAPPAPPASASEAGAAGAAGAASEQPGFGLDREILDVFMQEVQELLVEWEAGAAQLRRAPADAAQLATLRRAAHTLKGAANMMGFTTLGAAGWRVEQLLDLLDERELAVAPPILDFIDATYRFVSRASAATDPATEDTLAEEGAALDQRQQTLAEGIVAGQLSAPRDTPEASPATPDAAATGAAWDENQAGEVDHELLEVFVLEAEEHLAAFGRALIELDHHPDATEQLAEAKRTIHTLKGAAGALDYPATAALCHSIEDLFGTLDEHGRAPSREVLTLCFDSAEVLETLVRGIAAGRGEDAATSAPLLGRYATLLGRTAGAAPGADPTPPAERQAGARAEQAARSVRVDIAHLDNLLNLVGELVINRTSQEQYLERLGRTVAELGSSVERLRRVGGQLENRYEVAELLRDESPRAHLSLVGPRDGAADEFDALELDRYTELHRVSRELIEIAADISTASTEFDGLYDGFDQTLARQSRIATDLQDRMMEVRLVPVATIAARLYRAVRGVAIRRGRETDLVIAGETIEIDKVLLEEITDPLLHLVRNAADHGIESPEERQRRGKPTGGTIALSAAREGNEAVIRVRDDGAGIDLDRVLDKALARGIIRHRDGLTRDQLLDLIFLPGFSTSPTVSDISGRGVGLDVVRTNVARLKGTLGVESEPGVGTTFTIRLPIMLAVTRALLVRTGAQTFAIPLPVVEQVAFFRKELISTVGERELLDLGGIAYPVLHLHRALGIASGGDPAPGARALIVGNAERRVALVVDELVGQQEIVVKRLGQHLQSVAGVAGATILGSGQVVLILNVLDLIGTRRAAHEASPATPQPLRPQAAPQGGPGGRLALVVDDSLSVRRVLTRTLERDGWQVLGAKDGVEALELLSWAQPQVAVLDIEMPRMDGYELLALLRGGVEHRELPIAMLTSRAGEKHRRKAFALGASAYLIKPFEEGELLRTVRELGAAAQRQTVG